MSKATFGSVTDIPCTCGYLQKLSQDPNLPVTFKSEINEYHFQHVLPTGARISMILHHCPMCGGVASESHRDKLFATVSNDEYERLKTLIGDVRTHQDIERSFGSPDSETTVQTAAEMRITHPVTGTEERGQIRVLNYEHLSSSANVQFTVYSDGHVQGIIAQKYIGPPDFTDT